MNWTSVVRTAAAGAVAIAAATHASAQAPGAVRPITLTMGQGMPIKTPSPFAKVSVTDEKVAEVTPLSDREFIVNPRGFGSTNLFVLDAKNALVETLDITVAPSYASPTGGPAGNVKVYGRITDKDGKLIKPALYQCDGRNCDTVEEAHAVPVPTEKTAPGPHEGAPSDNGGSQ